MSAAIEEQQFKSGAEEQEVKPEPVNQDSRLCPFMGKLCNNGRVDGFPGTCRMWIRLEKVMMSSLNVPTREAFYVCALADKTPTMVPVMQQR